jgi:hypothetical protein
LAAKELLRLLLSAFDTVDWCCILAHAS